MRKAAPFLPEPKEWIAITPPTWTKPTDEFFAGRLSGESLSDDELHDSDMLIFRETFEREEIRPGQLVAIETPSGFLVKHAYFTLNGFVRLVSANPDYDDLVFKAADVKVIGIAEQLIRRLS